MDNSKNNNSTFLKIRYRIHNFLGLVFGGSVLAVLCFLMDTRWNAPIWAVIVIPLLLGGLSFWCYFIYVHNHSKWLCKRECAAKLVAWSYVVDHGDGTINEPDTDNDVVLIEYKINRWYRHRILSVAPYTWRTIDSERKIKYNPVFPRIVHVEENPDYNEYDEMAQEVIDDE